MIRTARPATRRRSPSSRPAPITATPRTACWASRCSRASTSRDPNKRNVFAYYSPRPGPGDNWPTRPRPAAQVVGYNQIMPLDADRRRQVRRAGLRARDPARAQDEDRRRLARSPSGFPGGPTDSGPGHVGGAGLDFDSAGNLYLGVGDDVSPNAPGHSGYAPMDYRAQERWDARKTSANTADLRGKVLRIKPTTGRDRLGLARPAAGIDVLDPVGQPVPGGHWPRPVPRSTRWASASRSRCTPTRRTRASSASASSATTRRPTTPAAAGRHRRVEPGQQAGQPGLAVLHRRQLGGQHDGALELRRRRDHRAASTTARTDTIPSDISYAPAGQTPARPTFDGLDMIPKPEPATIWKKYPNAGNTGLPEHRWTSAT